MTFRDPSLSASAWQLPFAGHVTPTKPRHGYREQTTRATTARFALLNTAL